MAADSMEIDDSLYSRQRYVLGDSAMHQMAQSSVFLSGMGGLGIEMAKNIVLAGVKAVTLHDTKQCETWDLGSNFFIRQEDVLSQRRRVEAVCPRVAELNPYVHVDMSSSALADNTDLSFLGKYQCVILTEARLSLQKRVNEFCHSQRPPIRFIGCDAYGICVRVFCDFGEEFEVSDPTGEEPKEIFIQSITQDNPGVVTCMDNQPHGLQTGQSVVFREVNGMVEVNGTTQPVSVLSPYSFAIGDTSQLQPYAHGGFFVMVKTPKTYRFETMERQLCDPQVLTPDFSKPEAPLQIHAAMLALDTFQEQHSRLPNTGCLQDAEVLLKLTEEVNATLRNKAPVNTELVRCLSRTARGTLPPLAAAVGGLASQEVLKAITGKFAPLQQWVGCGAIGCEMLKNFALLGVGLICITDPDLIEKSNLNRQFLFRPHHIQKPKSTTAAEATHDINPDLQVDAHLNKVCPATENRLVRCLSNQRPLLDSGTMGTKGHTEIIVPNLTESYNSHRDPPEEEIPFCTLKSFPSVIEHTIQWARDKFENLFVHKPSMYNSFWQTHSSADVVLQRMQAGESLEGAFQVIKLLSKRPSQWEHCITIARLKFEKYFKRKALQLLHSFPLDTRLKDGSLFWQSPKRPPAPFDFDLNDSLHFTFIVSTARLFAGIYNISYSEKVGHCIETNEAAKKPDSMKMPLSSEEEREAITQLEQAIATDSRLQVSPLQFEKDDDSNGHVDFVTSASALRARMYAIEPADRLKTKRIAGKIIPAIATATAAVAGLVALELIKVVGGYEFESFKNWHIRNSLISLSHFYLIQHLLFFYFPGMMDFTLSDFMNAVREKYGIEPTMVVHGVKMLYVPVMPGHSKRLKLTMQKLIKPSVDRRYVDLTVSFAPEADGDDDLPGPPVRYFFSRNGETP
uniref:Ubiquitin-like modifier-activating enzyme 6 n=1 Tax=Sander lucioperca TaxID=283035 RepID=A0A8D0AU30_SANLU